MSWKIENIKYKKRKDINQDNLSCPLIANFHIVFYLMKDHGFISKINKRFWETESQWPQTSTEASNKNECLHL